MRVTIAGGSGFIGRHIARALRERGEAVVILTRGPSREGDGIEHVHWDGRRPGDWQRVIDGSGAIINLCGRSVDCRKTPDHRDEILRSRVEPTRALARAIAESPKPPGVWVQMSTVHIYGDPPRDLVDEDSAIGLGLAPDVGLAWEAACCEADLPRTRRVLLRTSFVLGRDGGALQTLRRLTRLGLGGRIGHGRQGISWIHEDDLAALALATIDDERYHGAYNATAPHPVSNREFMRELRRTLGVPIGLPAAAWVAAGDELAPAVRAALGR